MKEELEKKLQDNAVTDIAEEAEEKKAAGIAEQQPKGAVSETWAEDTIADLDDYIESQGIYLRQ
ncbi:MAG: hypothetical protein LIO99_05690 [Clostridiales bacterium]|nr:hypothetical protein [Clostridiales bacterium]